MDLECQGPFIQVIHTGNQWVVASSIGGAKDEVTVYDSLYTVVDKGTHDLLEWLLKNVNSRCLYCSHNYRLVCMTGVFTLAFCTSLAMEQDLSDVKFDENVMREQLESCFERKHLTTFPKF